MSSFTNTPPKQAKKFQFDNDFEQEEESTLHHPDIHAHEPVDIEPPAPVFSEADLASTRQQAFQQGVEQGKTEARNGIESNLSVVAQGITVALGNLLANEDQRLQQMNEIVLRTTMATLKKIWPTIAQAQAASLVEHTVRQSLEYNPEESRIVIRVHDTILDTLIQHLPQIQAQQAFAGKIIVLADQTVGPSDCKVEWADGGMERLSRNVSVQIDLALERILVSFNTSNSQNADPERISP